MPKKTLVIPGRSVFAGIRFAGSYRVRPIKLLWEAMNIIYIIGLVVVVLAVLSFFGLR